MTPDYSDALDLLAKLGQAQLEATLFLVGAVLVLVIAVTWRG